MTKKLNFLLILLFFYNNSGVSMPIGKVPNNQALPRTAQVVAPGCTQPQQTSALQSQNPALSSTIRAARTSKYVLTSKAMPFKSPPPATLQREAKSSNDIIAILNEGAQIAFERLPDGSYKGKRTYPDGTIEEGFFRFNILEQGYRYQNGQKTYTIKDYITSQNASCNFAKIIEDGQEVLVAFQRTCPPTLYQGANRLALLTMLTEREDFSLDSYFSHALATEKKVEFLQFLFSSEHTYPILQIPYPKVVCKLYKDACQNLVFPDFKDEKSHELFLQKLAQSIENKADYSQIAEALAPQTLIPMLFKKAENEQIHIFTLDQETIEYILQLAKNYNITLDFHSKNPRSEESFFNYCVRLGTLNAVDLMLEMDPEILARKRHPKFNSSFSIATLTGQSEKAQVILRVMKTLKLPLNPIELWFEKLYLPNNLAYFTSDEFKKLDKNMHSRILEAVENLGFKELENQFHNLQT